jgi:hypothetical protein
MRKLAGRVLLIGIAATLGASAGEYVVLTNGFRMHVDRREAEGATTRLYTGSGTIEVPSATIAAIEREEHVPAATPVQIATPSAQPPKPSPCEMVRQAALRNGLPPEFVDSVARVESGCRMDAISHKGAIGVMQLMPGTAAVLQADPHDVEQNIEAGVRHLRELLLRYNGDARLALAAYNAGPGAVAKHNGIPPYPETRTYVDKVLARYRTSAKQ